MKRKRAEILLNTWNVCTRQADGATIDIVAKADCYSKSVLRWQDLSECQHTMSQKTRKEKRNARVLVRPVAAFMVLSVESRPWFNVSRVEFRMYARLSGWELIAPFYWSSRSSLVDVEVVVNVCRVLAASPSSSIILSLLVNASTCLPTILPLLDSQRGCDARSRGKRWRDVVITSAQALKKVLTGAFSKCISAVDPLAGGIVSRAARNAETTVYAVARASAVYRVRET